MSSELTKLTDIIGRSGIQPPQMTTSNAGSGADYKSSPMPMQVVAIQGQQHYIMISQDRLDMLSQTSRDHFGDIFWAALTAACTACPSAFALYAAVQNGQKIDFWTIAQGIVFLLAIPTALIAGSVYFQRGAKRRKLEEEFKNYTRYTQNSSGELVRVNQDN
jgi:hypothetical protein